MPTQKQSSGYESPGSNRVCACNKYQLGLLSQTIRALSVKIEVDTHPPAEAILQTDLARRHVTLRLQVHDRASLLAGMLHAFLQRDYVKGCGPYDLMWDLSNPEWPPPNLNLLRNALVQKGWKGLMLPEDYWQALVDQR